MNTFFIPVPPILFSLKHMLILRHYIGYIPSVHFLLQEPKILCDTRL